MLKLSLDALEILDTIDRGGSFAAAGKQIHRVASTISYTVGKLEAELGVQLFERHGPRAELTAAGRELLKEGRSLLKAARDLEHRVQRVASGWETELTIVLDSMFSPRSLEPDLHAFYGQACYTRLHIVQESLGGTWEALVAGRADLAVGAAGDGPPGGGYVTMPLGPLAFRFAVAPGHALATRPEPLLASDLQDQRAVVVADSGRVGGGRSVGVLLGQDTLTVASMGQKYDCQLAGLGFGFLPAPCVDAAVARGQLVAKAVETPRAPEMFYLAWRSGEQGAALRWWRERLAADDLFSRLVAALPGVAPA